MNDRTTRSGVVAACADELAAAEASRQPIPPLTARHRSLGLGEAYRIQRHNVERRLALGEKVVGHKVGLTARAMQELFGVHEPDYGHLLDTMLHPENLPLDLHTLIDPQIEVEPAFVLARPLAGPGIGIREVLAATDHIRACFEVIDSRIIDWRIGIVDTVADNGSSARVVLGAQRVAPVGLVLEDLETVLEIDGVVTETGNTGAILGHPANGVAWLANKLAEFGVSLRAGDIVLPGTCTRCCRIAGHTRVRGRIAGLGEVNLSLANEPTITPHPRR